MHLSNELIPANAGWKDINEKDINKEIINKEIINKENRQTISKSISKKSICEKVSQTRDEEKYKTEFRTEKP